jgi:hypothetical protein
MDDIGLFCLVGQIEVDLSGMVWYFHKTYVSYDVVNEIEVCLDIFNGLSGTDKCRHKKSNAYDGNNSIINDIINYDLNDFDDSDAVTPALDTEGNGDTGLNDVTPGLNGDRNGGTSSQDTANSCSNGHDKNVNNDIDIDVIDDMMSADRGVNHGTGLKKWMSRAHLGYIYGGKSRTHVSHTGYWSEGMKSQNKNLGTNPWGMTLWGVWETSSHGSHFELQKGGVFNASPVL